LYKGTLYQEMAQGLWGSSHGLA